MKKISILIMVLLLAVVGCSANDMEAYRQAVEKTDAVEAGVSRTDLQVNLTFNKEGLDPEVSRQLSNYEKVVFESNSSFNKVEDAIDSSMFISVGGMGFDSQYIQVADESIIKVPVLGKYLRLNQLTDPSAGNAEMTFDYSGDWVSEETMAALEEAWNTALVSGNVVKGEKDILETPEGAVRVTRYDVSPDPEAVTTFLRQASLLVSEDPVFAEQMDRLGHTRDDIVLQDLMTEWVNTIELVSVRVVDYIDVDGYIVDEILRFELEMEGQEPGSMTGFTFELQTGLYEIEKEQNIQLPELTAENTLDMEDLSTDMPAMFEQMINQ